MAGIDERTHQGPVGMVVVDAWIDTVEGSLSVKDPQQARQALHPWFQIATHYSASVLLVTHTNRATDTGTRNRMGLTGVLRQKARVVLYAQQDEAGKRVSRIAAVSAPRQQGKSALLQSMAMAGVLLLDVQKVIIAAQETKTAALAFEQLANMFTVHEDLRRSVNTIINGIGRQSINLKSGQQIQLFARNRASVRGQTCGLYLSDESQYLDAEAWASILPTMAAVKEPLACLFGTPNTRAADGAVWTQLHDNAWRPDPPAGSTWVEWSADPAADITDPAVWRSANPSWRVTEEAMRTEFEALTIDDFRRERGGVSSEFGGRPAFSAEAWLKAVSDDRPEPDIRPSGLGIDMSPTGAEVTVVACWKSVNDPTAHVELVGQLAQAGDLNG